MRRNRGFAFPIFGIVLRPLISGVFCSGLRSVLILAYAQKWGISGGIRAPYICSKFRKIADNLPVFSDPLFPNPNRGRRCPISRSFFLRAARFFAPIFSPSLVSISAAEGPFPDTDYVLGIFVKSREIAAISRCLARCDFEP